MKDENKALKPTDEPLDLRIRTKHYASRVIRLYVSLPKNRVAEVIGHQLLRSATSVGANYREACRSRSNAEFVSKLGDVLKELDESSYWLELLTENHIVVPAKLEALQQETEELLSIFTAISKKRKNAG